MFKSYVTRVGKCKVKNIYKLEYQEVIYLMIDCHINLERGPYTVAWLDEFVKTAVKRGLDEIYLL